METHGAKFHLVVVSACKQSLSILTLRIKIHFCDAEKTALNLPGCLELCEQSIISSQGKVEGVGLVVVWV